MKQYHVKADYGHGPYEDLYIIAKDFNDAYSTAYIFAEKTGYKIESIETHSRGPFFISRGVLREANKIMEMRHETCD